MGTTSPFSIETFGRPRRITIDPDHHVLTNSSDVKLRAAILRGQAMQQQGDLTGALLEFNKALDLNKNSSLPHYRIAEVFFLQRNYQSSANAYREAINGDGEPRWTEVWSRIQLGKIFDITGQRERAVNEYRQALQTNDNTFGALEEARKVSAEGLRAAQGKAIECGCGLGSGGQVPIHRSASSTVRKISTFLCPQDFMHTGSMVLDCVLRHKRALRVMREGIDFVREPQESSACSSTSSTSGQIDDLGKIWLECWIQP